MRRFVIAVVAVVAVVPSAALAAGVTGTFTGKTSQGKRVRLIVKRGDIKRGSEIPYTVTCQHGTLSGTMKPYGPIRHSHFAVSVRNTQSVGNGYKARNRSSLKITLVKRHALGEFGARITVLNAKGHIVDHCSVLLVFSASR